MSPDLSLTHLRTAHERLHHARTHGTLPDIRTAEQALNVAIIVLLADWSARDARR